MDVQGTDPHDHPAFGMRWGGPVVMVFHEGRHTMNFTTYPNIQQRQKCDEETKGVIRQGMVVENAETIEADLANRRVVVTREGKGYARCYVWLEGYGWDGPHTLKSEEIKDDE